MTIKDIFDAAADEAMLDALQTSNENWQINRALCLAELESQRKGLEEMNF